VIRVSGLMIGYALSASALSGVMAGCRSTTSESLPEGKTEPEWSPSFLSSAEFALTGQLAETILPETETPGARAAGVDRYIDDMLFNFYQIREQKEFRRGLLQVDSDCSKMYGKNFLDCDGQQQLEYLQSLDKEAFEQINAQTDNNDQMVRPFFAMIKELTWTGFFTSELIGEQYLHYDHIPGGYHGCVPIEETGPLNWSLQ